MSEKIISVENGMEDGMELDNPRDDAEADAEILREDPELKDDAYMLSLLLESTTSTKTRTEDDSGRDLWEDLPWWLALNQRLQHNYLIVALQASAGAGRRRQCSDNPNPRQAYDARASPA
jgi:hypothetical protein